MHVIKIRQKKAATTLAVELLHPVIHACICMRICFGASSCQVCIQNDPPFSRDVSVPAMCLEHRVRFLYILCNIRILYWNIPFTRICACCTMWRCVCVCARCMFYVDTSMARIVYVPYEISSGWSRWRVHCSIRFVLPNAFRLCLSSQPCSESRAFELFSRERTLCWPVHVLHACVHMREYTISV